MDASEFAEAMRRAGKPERRVAWLGALLRKETRRKIEIVGGSAVEVYLSSQAYVSEDVDVVGDRNRLEDVLRRLGFKETAGRSQRSYWYRKGVGLIDLVGDADRSGLPPRRVDTPYGAALLSAPEPLIIRRLSRSVREDSEALFRQAVELARLPHLDWAYLESEARYEKVEAPLNRVRKLVGP